MLNIEDGYLTMHSSVLSNITSYKSQSHNGLCPPLNSPTILGTKTAPFFAVLSSGSVDYQRLTTIWEPPSPGGWAWRPLKTHVQPSNLIQNLPDAHPFQYVVAFVNIRCLCFLSLTRNNMNLLLSRPQDTLHKTQTHPHPDSQEVARSSSLSRGRICRSTLRMNRKSGRAGTLMPASSSPRAAPRLLWSRSL